MDSQVSLLPLFNWVECVNLLWLTASRWDATWWEDLKTTRGRKVNLESFLLWCLMLFKVKSLTLFKKTSKFIIIGVFLGIELAYWPFPNHTIVELKLFSLGSHQSKSFMVIVLFTFVSSEMPLNWFHYWAVQIGKSVMVLIVIHLQNSFSQLQGQRLH